jgi:uroporphyrinogen-III synthase
MYDQRFVKSDLPVLHVPLTQQVNCVPTIPQKACDFVLVTSRKAAEAFLKVAAGQKELWQKAEMLTFGMETYKYLLGQNIKTRLIEAPSAKEFAEILLCELKKGTCLWFPRPLETAFPLSEHLRAHGLEIHDLEVYKTEPLQHFDPLLIQKLTAEPSVVCFASPSAVKSFVDLIRSSDEARFYRYIPVAIGNTTMSSAQSYFNEIHIASQATLQSLWEKGVEVGRTAV